MLKTLIITVISTLCFFSIRADTTRPIDLGTIDKYDSILDKISYYTGNENDLSLREVLNKTFSNTGENFPDRNKLPYRCFLKLSVTNSGNNDTFWLYMGKAQEYTMYEYDSSTKETKVLDNHTFSFSYVAFNQLPFTPFIVRPGETKTFYIQAKIRFYNRQLVDPIIIIPKEITTFSFDYFLKPNVTYLLVSFLLLGIILSLFLSFVEIYYLTFNKDYLFYTLALLSYLLYFFLRIIDNFIYGRAYWFLYDFSVQLLQIGGSIFILLFVISFLQIRETIPKYYRLFRIIVLMETIFLAINIPLTYVNETHRLGIIIFNVLRVFIFPYYILLIAIVTKHIRTRETRYIVWGSLISILLFFVALYQDGIGTYKNDYIDHRKIALLAFTSGILIQMRFFMRAIFFRTTTENDMHIRELERLHIDRERTELEKQKAVILTKERERNRIAKEIHDDLGSGLTSIRLLSEIAKVKGGQGQKKELERISETSNRLIDKMNEIIWSMNSRNDTLPNLIAYLRQVIVAYFEPLPMQLRIVIPDNIIEIHVTGKTRRNILLAVKEALHNIAKHSRATEVDIVFRIDESLFISITDNGIGFDPATIPCHKNGLQNIRERLSGIGGACTILNNGGTSVILNIPL